MSEKNRVLGIKIDKYSIVIHNGKNQASGLTYTITRTTNSHSPKEEMCHIQNEGRFRQLFRGI